MPLDRGQTYDKYSDVYIDSLGTPSILNKRISYLKKKSKDNQWYKECIRFIDGQHGCLTDEANMRRIAMNYDLANGFGEEAMQKYGEKYVIEELASEGFTDQDIYGNIQHHPVIQQVYNAMVGEQQLRPLTPIAIDTSMNAMSDKRRKKLELTQEYLREKVISPIVSKIQAQVQQQYAQEYGITDLFQMSPQQQMQFTADVEQRTKAATPNEINNYMRKDYKSPGSMQAQRILDFIMSELNIKFLTDENFKNLVIAGDEIYKVGIRNNMTTIEIVNPEGFYYMSRPNTQFIEEGVAWKYEQIVMYNDIFAWHGPEIGNSKIIQNKLDLLQSGGRRKFGEPHPSSVYDIQSGNIEFIKNSPNVLTREGQEYLQSRLARGYNRRTQNDGEVRYVHAAWKGLRKIKQIKRYNYEKDHIKSIFIDESYRFNPLKVDENGYRDIEEYIMWAPEINEGVEVENDIYFGIGQTPYQYKSLHNPWDVKGPYVGGSYSKLMNNTEKVSPIDPAKAWQYKFNLQMARIHELEATDLGNVLHTTLNSIPLDWSYKKHFLMMKYGKLAITDTTREGYDPNTSALIKQLDLSTTNRIADSLQLLDFYRHQIILAMNYNPSRLGLQGPTVQVTNNQQNIIQSSYQTNDIYATHNKIVENLLNVAVDVTKVALRDNNEIAGYILDDLSSAELALDWTLLDKSQINVKITNSSQEYQDVQDVKQLLQPLAQNGMLTAPDIIRIQFAKSKTEILNFAEDALAQSEERARQAEQRQAELMAKEQESQAALMKMNQEFELFKQERDHQNAILKEIIDATRYAQEKDIDKNKINDDITIQEVKQRGELEKLERAQTFEREKLKEESKRHEKELKNDILLERIRAKNRGGSSKPK